jgi:hypothetical protein
LFNIIGGLLNKGIRFLRALMLIVWLYGLLVWIYVAARIVVNDNILFDPFLDTIPWLSFMEVAAFSFFISAASLFAYLYFWGFSCRAGEK